MAKLSKADLSKVDNKTGLLKYWWPFIEMIEKGEDFLLGPQGKDGSTKIASNNKANTRRMTDAMRNCITVAQVKKWLLSKNYEVPTPSGKNVKITDLWKENVKPLKSQSSDKIGGRDTEVYSEVLAQYCLAYAIVHGEAATMQNSLDINGTDVKMKPEALRSCKQLIVTPSTFNLNSTAFVDRLARFGSQPISSSEYWMDTQGKAMMMIQNRFKFPRTARVYNDKIFDANTFTANPYTAYLIAKKSQSLPGEDKWNPADIWVMTPKGVQQQVHLNRTLKQRGKSSINVANNFLMGQFRSKDIVPISLKKPSARPHMAIMNSDEYFERIILGGTSNPTIEMTADNRDVKINFTLETVQIPSTRGLKGAAQARRRGSAVNGQVVPNSQKHIRIKYHVNNKKIELEYTQTGEQSLARAKMGSLGNKNFTDIINNTTKEGVRKLNTIQENYSDIGVKTNPWFNGQLDKLDDAQYARLQAYVGDLWKAITKDNAPDFSKITELNNTAKLSSKAMAGEFGLSIAGINNKTVMTRLITHLYEACASVAFGSGLTKEERALVEGSGDVPARRIKFHSSVHVKVY